MVDTTTPQWITFSLRPGAAVITRRAAARLGLTVVDFDDGTFRVEFTDALEAWQLGNLSTQDPAWALEFLNEGRRP